MVKSQLCSILEVGHNYLGSEQHPDFPRELESIYCCLNQFQMNAMKGVRPLLLSILRSLFGLSFIQSVWEVLILHDALHH